MVQTMTNNNQFTGGYVTLPIETYNELMARVATAEKLIKVEKVSWSESYEIVFDKQQIYAAGLKKLLALNPQIEDTHTIEKVSEMYLNDPVIARVIPQDEETVEATN